MHADQDDRGVDASSVSQPRHSFVAQMDTII